MAQPLFPTKFFILHSSFFIKMDAYYNRTEVSNSDLTELKNLLP